MGFGQVTYSNQGGTVCALELDFESAGGYNTSIPEFSDGDSDYFTRTDGSGISSSISLINSDGSFFAAQDIDGEGAVLPVLLNISNIDISNLTNLQFSIDLAEDDDGVNEDWDANDYVRISFSIDGSPYQNLLFIESELAFGNNGKPRIDTDFDGVGDGTEITDTFSEFTESIAGTGAILELRIEFNLNAGDEDIALDNIRVCGVDSSIDSNSTVVAPDIQLNSGTIQADATTLFSHAVPVFKFKVQDVGTSDGLDTIIEEFRLVAGSSNTANWPQVIQGVEVEAEGDGGQVFNSDKNVIINNDEIIIEILNTPQNEMTTTDGGTREYTIGVYLNETGITDQEVIQFATPVSSSGWEVESNSSQFAPAFSSFEGNTFVIDVVGNGLRFLTAPETTIVNENMNTVQIAYTDSNANVDLSLTDAVSITSSGNLQGNVVTNLPVDGIATFSGLIHTQAQSALTLTASTTQVGISNAVSNLFDIIELPEFFISEIADPTNFEGRFVEIYNAGITPVDLSSYVLVRERDGGPSLFDIPLNGTLGAKAYFVIGRGFNDGFVNAYGFVPEQLDPSSGAVIAGNGNDSYFISTNASSDESLRNSQLDIYGEIGINAYTNTASEAEENTDGDANDAPWEYEDSHAYRNTPTIKNTNTTWTAPEWIIESNATISDMTPGYGDNDYIYNGSWTNIGLGDPIGNSTTDQNIFVRSGSVTLTGDIAVGDLVVRSGATLTLAPDVKLSVSGDIVNEGTIIFDSDATDTAVLEAVADNTRVVGNGFEVRRYIPVVQTPNPIRAFRYLSSSVTTTTSIFENWQQNGLNPGDPGYEAGNGTHITGAVGSVGEISPNGFDQTSTGFASMYFWDESENTTTLETDQIGWTSIANTNATSFSAGDAYAILIRGDRSSTLNSNTQTGPSTTLRTTGKIHIGDYPVPNLSSTDGHFNLVGNPYQSQVDLQALLSNATDVNPNLAYIWDPTLGSLGGYAVIDFSLLPTVNTQIDFGATTPSTSGANQYLQPQQAFFVATTGPNPEITFTESVKNNNTAQTSVFSEEPADVSVLDITLKSDNGITYDGVRLVYGTEYFNTIDDLDAIKFWNYTDNLSIISNSDYLSVEKRNLPPDNEVTQLYLDGLSLSSYMLEASFYAANPVFDVYLVDNYTDHVLQIHPNSHFSYAFSIEESIPESAAPDRFDIVYTSSTLATSNNDFNAFSVYPNPLSSEFVYISSANWVENEIDNVLVYGLEGRLIRSYNKNEIIMQENLVKIKLDDEISNGIYILAIKTKSHQEIQKIIVNR
jgi:hypothetical protein